MAVDVRRRHEAGGEQSAQLVAGEHAPAALGRGDAHGQTVGVGIVGECHMGVDRHGEGQELVGGAGLLGIGKRDAREVGVGISLGGHGGQAREPGGGERPLQQFRTHPVHRRGSDAKVRARRVGTADEAHHHGDVVVDQIAGRGRRRERGADGVEPVGDGGGDVVGDPTIGGRDDLGAVAPVDLDAVVLGRVVAGGHDDAGGGVEVADAPGDQRRRLWARYQAARDAGGFEHGDDAERVLRRAVPGVMADQHPPFGRAVGVGVQRAGQPGRRLSGHEEIEPVRTRPHLAAQPGGAEVAALTHEIGELDQVAGRPRPLEHVPERRRGDGVGVGGDPGLGRREEWCGVAHPRKPRSGRPGRCSQLSAG
ncbi:MAG: hypothetical protein V9G12_01135 [Microthrixaceae bacterium]